ncbi:MAG: penicillin acylase family protein [Vicinamibacteria bacterium]
MRYLGLGFMALFVAGCGEGNVDDVHELARSALSQMEGEIVLEGLSSEVEVLRDRFGIPHIYAQNEEDLFFAQGFVVAQDRLWQMEVWRRWSEGRMAELIGEEGFAHDRLVRMLQFRGPFDETELTSYHPGADRIVSSFVRGINAFLSHSAENLPVEFQLTGLRPEPWKKETVLLRARVGMVVRDALEELRLARAVAELGAEEANRRERPDPFRELIVPEGLEPSKISEDAERALEGDLYGVFPRLGLLSSVNRGARETSPGSNNWALRPELTATGKAFMVDDPHREVSLPAHRYIVHLVAPGWDVIGATESTIPGVIRGHNGRIAWGRTATGSDQADVYIEQLKPGDPGQVLYRGEWEPLQIVTEEIRVKAEEGPRRVEYRRSRHGPVFFTDEARGIGYALRSKLQEPGTAEYLGGLRLDQAQTLEECLDEALYLESPPTNLVCADADGNIGWTIAALSPRRSNWHGRLPVPGTGEFEWDGFRSDLPRLVNPPEGFIATANNNTHPPDYDPPLFFVSGSPRYRRYERIRELLSSGSGFTREEMRAILNDSLSTEALEARPRFEGWTAASPRMERARAAMAEWDGRMTKESAAAAIYYEWNKVVDAEGVTEVEAGLERALDALASSQGENEAEWRWGGIHRSEFPHPLSSDFDLPSVERNGGGGTVNATGAVYRLVTDFSDLDRSLAIVAPGQSGQPGSPYYDNLLETWARGEMFELPYSRGAVEAATAHRLILKPK